MKPVDRLQGLLTRVQENRMAARPAPSAGASTASPQPTAAATAPKPMSMGASPGMQGAARQPSRAPIAEERVNLPQNRSMGARPPAAAPEPAPKPREAAPAPVPLATAAHSTRDRLSTPLEMALEDEINKSPSEPPTAQFAVSRPARPAPGKPSFGAARNPNDEEADFSVEAEPMREPNRSIAQVVSKHAPEIDATFGAMLRRSLSLRPR
jgi:hypothetical protein